jgi:predicted O-methyltransferase YrrM
LENLGKPLLFAGLWFAKLYRPTFHITSPVLHRVADRLGVYPLIDHYHEPLIMPKRHLAAPSSDGRNLPGIDLDLAGQRGLLADFSFQNELLAIPTAYTTLVDPYYENLAFPPFDAQILHSVIRHFKPSRILEVGSGETTRFALHALHLNAQGPAPVSGRIICIEPFEAAWLEDAGIEVRRSKVEDSDPSAFHALGEGDILFIDSSHVARPQGDVLFLFSEVVPTLKPGVLVHVHDVFTPRDYPRSWTDRRMLWDEQYILEALLTHNPKLKVLLAVNCLYHDVRQDLQLACPAGSGDAREPSSIWLQVTPS